MFYLRALNLVDYRLDMPCFPTLSTTTDKSAVVGSDISGIVDQLLDSCNND